MKCLFVDVGYEFEELDEPLGIEVLYSYIKDKFEDVTCSCFWANCEGEDYTTLFDLEKPDILAISTHVNTWIKLENLYEQYEEWIKKRQSQVLVLVGGILGTFEFECVLKAYPDVICMIGEGEDAIESIVGILSEKKTINIVQLKELLESQNSPNMAFYNMKGDLIIGNRLVKEDLSEFKFPVLHTYLEETVKSNGIVRIEASRGCPWNKCSFCVMNWKYAGKKWRPYSISKVITELITLSAAGAKTIYFTDEEFIGNDIDHLNNLIERIINLKKERYIRREIEFVASTSIQALSGKYGIKRDKIFNLLLRMKEAGFRSLFLGVESGSNTQLKRFRKGITVEETEEILLLLQANDIETDVGYILFDPLLTVNELEESLAFLKRTGLYKDISRFAKRLRIVPYTSYCGFSQIEKKTYDRNSVQFEYEFANESIKMIYEKYIEWENQHIKCTHKLQGEIRASVKTENRKKKVEQLKKFRYKEYYALCCLVECVRNCIDIRDITIEEIEAYCERKEKNI